MILQHYARVISRKIPKTLSGIETRSPAMPRLGLFCRAAKYLKPYQGLKQILPLFIYVAVFQAAKYLKPYQGLKQWQIE